MPAAEPAPELGVALTAALKDIGLALADCRDAWWVIGSAAMALHGAPVPVRDIDLLLSPADAARQLRMRGLPAAAGVEDERFHSDIFGTWQAGEHKVELFAGFKVRTAAGWRTLLPHSRERKAVGAAALYCPSVEELIEWGRLFGRDKDAAREALLRSLASRPGR